MKKLFYSLFALSILVGFTACEEKERAFPEYDNLEHGAFARQLSKTGNFFLTDVNNSAIDISVEFYDENKGKDVASYSWVVQYIDKANGGANSVAPVNILTIDAAQFSTNPETGLPFTSFGFTLPDVLSTLGLTTADVDGGSTFRFNATLTLNDGRTFTAGNTGSNVISSAPFSGLFSFDADLLCTSDLSGIYEVTTEGWCGTVGETIMTQWVETSSEGIYDVIDPANPDDPAAADFSYGAYYACYSPTTALPGGTLQIKDACNIISPIGASQWGEVYTYESVTVSGSTLVIVWSNDYGEGGTSTFVRTDGTDWPPLTN